MTPRGRQLLLLLVLVVVFAFLIGRQLLPGPGAGGGALATDAGTRAAGAGAASGVEVVELRLADLERSAARYSTARDPFRYAPPPRAAPPPPSAEELARRAAEAAARTAAPPPSRPALASTPQPPPVDVVYLGSFGPRNRRLAVFSDGNDIYNAFEGGVIKEKFVVVEIGLESVDVGFVGFPDASPERLAAGG